MAIRVPYTKFTFQNPNIPSLDEFTVIKSLINKNHDYSMEIQHKGFLKLESTNTKVFKIFTAILFILVTIYILGMQVFKPGSSFDMTVGLILGFYGFGYFGLILSKLLSYKSFSDYKWQSKKYYRSLKDIIASSDSYETFLSNYKSSFMN